MAADGFHLVKLAKGTAILLVPLLLGACLESEDTRVTTFMEDSGNQPYPGSYRTELLAFMRTYLNNPVGVHDAAMAEPVQRTVTGKPRYVSCLRFTPRESDGSYHQSRERAIVYVNGRLDRILENPAEICAGAVYTPFPELEKMTR
jgi:hypothetical protein